MTGARVLFRSGGLIAVDKPAGVLVVPGRQDKASLRQQLQESLGQPVWVVHRLDRDTSGVLLLALDAAAHRAASLAFEAGAVRKTYLALVSPPLERPQLVDVPLLPARRGRMRLAEQARRASRRAPACNRSNATGRQAWCRPSLSPAGRTRFACTCRPPVPRCGSTREYGQPAPLTEAALGGTGEEVVLARTPLHAARLVLPVGFGLPAVDVEAPLPDDMQRALALLRLMGPR